MTITFDWVPLLALGVTLFTGFGTVVWYLSKLSAQLSVVPKEIETLKTELSEDIHSLAKDVRATSKILTDERLQTAEIKARLTVVELETDNFVRKAVQ